MNRTLALAALMLASATYAQNLVPNGDFEDYTLCPTSLSQASRATGWSVISGSPDYFNRCNSNDSMGVPLNIIGYQDAYDGNGYMGAITYEEGGPYRECVQHALSSPLVPGVPVYLSMEVSPGGFGNDPNNNSAQFASSGIGLKFSVQPHADNFQLWSGNVALYLSSVLNDTADWVQVGGVYVPDSAYAFVAIGCFLPDSEMSVHILDPNGQAPYAYGFIDHVCVSPTASDCPLSIGIHEVLPPLWNNGANPAVDELRIGLDRSLVQGASLVIMDGSGRLCRSRRITDGTAELVWPLSGLASGSYYVQLRNSLGQYRPIHIVHLDP